MVTSTALTCYIRDLNTGTRVDFNIEKPESVNDSYSANFEPQSVKGRSSPFQSYANSGPRTISFSIKLSLDYNRDIREIVDSIRMMLKPFKSEGAIIGPHVKVYVGSALNINAIFTQFTCDWADGYKDQLYRTCTCGFSFSEVEDESSFNMGTEDTSYASQNSTVSVEPSTYKKVSSTKDIETLSEDELSSSGYVFVSGQRVNMTKFKTYSLYATSREAANQVGTAQTGEAGTYTITSMASGCYYMTNGLVSGWYNPMGGEG